MARNRHWTLEKQLLSYKKKQGSCWIFDGPLTDGYGVLKYMWKNYRAHKVSALLYLGLTKEDVRHVLHKCGNRACFNPKHLYLGTPSDNVRDTIRAGHHNSVIMKAKTHCPKGHRYLGENLMVGKQGRRCRTCHNSWAREHKSLTNSAGRSRVSESSDNARVAQCRAPVSMPSGIHSGSDGQAHPRAPIQGTENKGRVWNN